MRATCVVAALLPLALPARGADDAPAETRALLSIACDETRPWQARAGALRVLSRAETANPAALADLVTDAEPALLRRLALTAVDALDRVGSHVGTATTAALTDDDASVRREALRVVAARASRCEQALDGSLAALRDDAEANRVFAARATRALGLAGFDVQAAVEPLLALLGSPATALTAASALLLVHPSVASLRERRAEIADLLRGRAGPLPAAMLLATWAESDADTWGARLAAFAIEGDDAVRQGAHAALAWRAEPGRSVESHVRRAAFGPDAALVAVALAAPVVSAADRATRAATARRLVHHACPLVRTRARALIEPQ